MMQTKAFELRDRATFIPVLAVQMRSDNEGQHDLRCAREAWLLRRAGYAEGDTHPWVVLTRLDAGRAEYDPEAWSDRTYRTAHYYIQHAWDKLNTGDLIDVRVLLGETAAPCASERGVT